VPRRKSNNSSGIVADNGTKEEVIPPSSPKPCTTNPSSLPLFFLHECLFWANEVLTVFKKPLTLFSIKPMTGFYRDGYCRSGAADYGNHAVAGIVSEEFLDLSASQGNDLHIDGLSGSCK
jgi:hypothetical protein